jgi:hypothetical protein
MTWQTTWLGTCVKPGRSFVKGESGGRPPDDKFRPEVFVRVHQRNWDDILRYVLALTEEKVAEE